MRIPLTLVLMLTMTSAIAGEPTTFRTDDDPDSKLPWYQLVDGEFPPEGSAHYFSGELIQVDHLERKFMLRVDRTDKQNRSHFDLPIAATMLPYGSISYHGAPAALKDVPIGTHLHGWYYVRSPDDDSKPPEIFHNRRSIESEFNRCFRLEDDFSYHASRNQTWRISEVNLDEEKLSATLLEDGKPVGDEQVFDLQASTRVWQGKGFASLTDLAPDQEVQFNITWATLYGPGRIVEIWLDGESRALATRHQLEKHRIHIRERGLAGWVDEVDNQQRIVTITFFDGVDQELLDQVKKGQSASIAVARESLMTFDPVNDRKSGPVLDVKQITKAPGSSGIQVQIQPNLLLEGYRPKRIVRVYPAGWPVIALPAEERYFGR